MLNCASPSKHARTSGAPPSARSLPNIAQASCAAVSIDLRDLPLGGRLPARVGGVPQAGRSRAVLPLRQPQRRPASARRCAPYIEDGTVELNDWPLFPGQVQAYNDCIERHREDSRWIAFVDIDEFLFSPTGLTVAGGAVTLRAMARRGRQPGDVRDLRPRDQAAGARARELHPQARVPERPQAGGQEHRRSPPHGARP